MNCERCFGRWTHDELLEFRTVPEPDRALFWPTWAYFCKNCFAWIGSAASFVPAEWEFGDTGS